MPTAPTPGDRKANRDARAVLLLAWSMVLVLYVAFPAIWLRIDRISPEYDRHIFGRKLAYCLPGVRFRPHVGPYPDPALLTAGFLAAAAAAHVALRAVRLPLGALVGLWWLAFLVGCIAFGPNKLACAEDLDLAPHALVANLAWSAGGTTLFTALWIWAARPGWRRAVAVAPLIAVAFHTMACFIYVLSPFTSLAFIQPVGAG